jgi:hypothetical protein
MWRRPALFAIVSLLAVPVAGAATLERPAGFGVYFAPARNQSRARQLHDQRRCFESSKRNTGIDPVAKPPSLGGPVAPYQPTRFVRAYASCLERHGYDVDVEARR